jgi:hypothetical protein
MECEEIESAYEESSALVRSAISTAPATGWSIEMIGAHIALNNEQIALVAEKVARGESASYDNASRVGDDTLRAFVDRVGGGGGIADGITRSAHRLAEARRQLGDNPALTEVPVVIHDGGEVVVEQPLAIGDFIVGNATYHLEAHLEQARSLTS